MSTTVKINERDLRQLVNECVSRVLKEDYYGDPDDLQDEDLSGEVDIQLSQQELSRFQKMIPGGAYIVKNNPRGLAIRVYYSSYGEEGTDIHKVKVMDPEVRGWQSQLLSVEERRALEAALKQYGDKGGFDEYIFGEVNTEFDDYDDFDDEVLTTPGELGHGSDEAWVGDESKPERFIGDNL